jgi:hypothetical protein
MTDEQWRYLTARLDALEALALSLAQVSPKKRDLRSAYLDQKEFLTNAGLNSSKGDEDLAEILRAIERIQRALWGASP